MVLARGDVEDRVEGFPGCDDLGLLRGHGGTVARGMGGGEGFGGGRGPGAV